MKSPAILSSTSSQRYAAYEHFPLTLPPPPGPFLFLRLCCLEWFCFWSAHLRVCTESSRTAHVCLAHHTLLCFLTCPSAGLFLISLFCVQNIEVDGDSSEASLLHYRSWWPDLRYSTSDGLRVLNLRSTQWDWLEDIHLVSSELNFERVLKKPSYFCLLKVTVYCKKIYSLILYYCHLVSSTVLANGVLTKKFQ